MNKKLSKNWKRGRFCFPVLLELLKKLKNCEKCNSIQWGQKGLICPENQDIVPGSLFHHIMVQGINKEFIFDEEECVQEYKKIIIEKLKDSNINILAYCIMNNHAHFLIYSPQIEYIVKFMQKINTTYSRFYNKKFNRVGYVYRDRYKSQTIVDRKHLINCLIYIHNNPLKAGIVSRVQDYKYSSYLEFLNGGTIINDKSIKILFGDIPNFRNVFNAIHKNQIEDTFMDVKDTDITQIINKFEKKYNISVDAFKHDKKIMKEFIDIARNETNITLVSLANILDVSKSTVSYYSRL